jgi:hypothetical protein
MHASSLVAGNVASVRKVSARRGSSVRKLAYNTSFRVGYLLFNFGYNLLFCLGNYCLSVALVSSVTLERVKNPSKSS